MQNIHGVQVGRETMTTLQARAVLLRDGGGMARWVIITIDGT